MAYSGLAKTTFVAGPEDALAAADAYKANDIVNASVDTVDYSLSLPESPVGLKIKLPKIPELGLKLPKLNQVDVIKSVIDSTSDRNIKNCFTNMSEAAKGLLSIPGKLLGKVEASINGVVTKIKKLGDSLSKFDLNKSLEKIGNLKAIGCTVNSLTNGNYSLNIVDKAGLSGLISGITKEASSLGINNVFSSISNVVRDKDVLLSAARDLLPAAAKDIYLLKDLSTTGIGNSIKSMMPSISGDSIHNFRINPGTKNFQLPEIYSDLKYTLDRVDNSWNKIIRNGEETLSGVYTSKSNSAYGDFHKVMSASVMSDYSLLPTPSQNGNITMPNYVRDEQFLMLTKDFDDSLDVQDIFKRDFSSIPVKVNSLTEIKSVKAYDQSMDSRVEHKSVYSLQTDSIGKEIKVKITTNSNTNTVSVIPDLKNYDSWVIT